MPEPPAPSAERERARRAAASTWIGLGLTALVALATAFGLTQRLDHVALDAQTRWFAFATPEPSTRIVHIDIDDASLERIGRWPWPRAELAKVVDELNRAGAAVITFDVLFGKPQQPRLVRAEPTGAGAGDGDGLATVDDDGVLADALARAGNVVLAMSMPMKQTISDAGRRVIEVLKRDVTIGPDAAAEAAGLGDAERQRASGVFASLRIVAAGERFAEMMAGGATPTFERCLDAVMPGGEQDERIIRSLKLEYGRQAVLSRLRPRLPATDAPSEGVEENVPILRLYEAAADVGCVDYEADADGRVRSVPLWIVQDGRRYPHLALRSACMLLGVELDELRVTEDQTTLPDAALPDGGTEGAVRIPMMSRRPGDTWTKYPRDRIWITWPSNADHWVNLFDPSGGRGGQRLPIGPLVEAAGIRRALADYDHAADYHLQQIVNHSMMQGAMPGGLVGGYQALVEASSAGPLSDEQVDRRRKLRAQVLEVSDFLLPDLESLPDLEPKEKQLLEVLKRHGPALREADAAADRLRPQLREYEAAVAPVRGAVCLIGWTGTGAIADFIPTSINERTPGVVVHGAVLNAILTDHFLERGPRWLDVLIVIAVGAAVTLGAARWPPVLALVVTLAALVAWFGFSGIALQDYGNTLVASASPMVAGAVAWVGVTVYRLVVEQRDRARITRQFKNYVSPDLVDYLVAQPHLIRLEGETREMTCVFTDVAGFTTISESLGPEQTARLRNKYLGIATEQLMDHRALVNKYLGDGIMAFWGAPIINETHAFDACTSVLACIEAIRRLDDDEMLAGLPRLFMRVGISTGPMMVGDFGAPPTRSDYTVIGNAVNLASRLESANKQLDTQILLSARTHQLVADRVLARFIGRIRVVGKTEYEPVYQLLNTADRATDDQRDLVVRTSAAVDAFIEGRFSDCLAALDTLAERAGGDNKLIAIYREACHAYLADGKPDDFDGALTLTEK